MSDAPQPLLRLSDLPAGHPGYAILTGRTPFFAVQSDPRFSYCLYVPTSYRVDDPAQPLLVAVHGTGRRAEEERESFVGLAEERGCLVLAPLFPVGIGDPNDIDTYKVIDRAGVRYDRVLLDMVAEAGHRWGIHTDRFHLCGFSGGGQFVQRFLYLHPGRLASVSIGAPGRVTLFDRSQPWPAGVADVAARFGAEPDDAGMARVPVQVVVGSQDDVIRTGEPGGERSRLDRARDLAASLGAAGCTVALDLVPDIGHDGVAAAPTMAAFLARQMDRSGLGDSPNGNET